MHMLWYPKSADDGCCSDLLLCTVPLLKVEGYLRYLIWSEYTENLICDLAYQFFIFYFFYFTFISYHCKICGNNWRNLNLDRIAIGEMAKFKFQWKLSSCSVMILLKSNLDSWETYPSLFHQLGKFFQQKSTKQFTGQEYELGIWISDW